MTTLETLLNDPDTAGAWSLLPDRSAITFTIANAWGLLRVRGRFTEFSGEGHLTGGGDVSGRVDIRAASLNTGIARRDKHLRSEDFFDVERFGQISVVVTGLQPTGGRSADLRATFTVKGVSAPLPVPATITELDDGSVRVSGRAEVDRARFNLGGNPLGMIGASAAAAAELVFARSPR